MSRFNHYYTQRSGFDWDGVILGVVFVTGLILVGLNYIPVQTLDATVLHGSWRTRVELLEERTSQQRVCSSDVGVGTPVTCETVETTETVVIARREHNGDWSEDITWPESFVTRFGQSNRRTGRFIISYQHDGKVSRGTVGEQEFGNYYLGMPCTIRLNIYGAVIRSNCGLPVGR